MALSKKHPTNPIAPLNGKMPESNIPSDLFDANQSTGSFESECLRIKENAIYAEEIFEKVRVNGKGKELFKSKEEFLIHLDNALLHYEIFRPCVIPDESGDLNNQRKYFKQLQKAVSNLNVVLGNMHENHSRRLAHAGFVLPQFLTGEGLDNDFIQQSKSLEAATIKVRENLKGKNRGQYAELFLLIEQLTEMYETCTGKFPTTTYSEHNADNKGVFFDLVQAARPLVSISNDKHINDNTVINGIKLAQKS